MVEYELQLKATRQATPQTSEPPLSPSHADEETEQQEEVVEYCLLYTSPSPRD